MPTYLERYMAGEHLEVWTELQRLGPAVREEAYFADALGVARETMRRVRLNLEMLVERLLALGYEFESPLQTDDILKSTAVLVPPQEAMLKQLEALEALG